MKDNKAEDSLTSGSDISGGNVMTTEPNNCNLKLNSVQLRHKLGELQQLLHESHERESMAEGEAEAARNEVDMLRKELYRDLAGMQSEESQGKSTLRGG